MTFSGPLVYDRRNGKGSEEEEYAQPLKREDGSSAERRSEERHAEGSFGSGMRKRLAWHGLHSYAIAPDFMSGREVGRCLRRK